MRLVLPICTGALVACATLLPLSALANCPPATAPAPAPSASPSASGEPIGAVETATSPVPTPRPTPESQFYNMGSQTFTVDRDANAFWYFQQNHDGTAKEKYEVRYRRELWNDCSQLQIRIPWITRFPTGPDKKSPDGNPYTGFGNLELRYYYNGTSPTFDHSISTGFAFPTASNGVESLDTVFKAFYVVKWKWNGGAVSYTNEYDQSVIRPPGSSETSYYEGDLVLPYVPITPDVKGLKLSAFYYYRILFNEGSVFKSAAGGQVVGNLKGVDLSFIDTWGISTHALWKYKAEATASVRF